MLHNRDFFLHIDINNHNIGLNIFLFDMFIDLISHHICECRSMNLIYAIRIDVFIKSFVSSMLFGVLDKRL
jgi:hypothetical protein